MKFFKRQSESPVFNSRENPVCFRCIEMVLARSRWDLWFDCGLWNEDLTSCGDKAFKTTWRNPKVSDLVSKTNMIETTTQVWSKAEWKRKLHVGAFKFSRNGASLGTLIEDVVLDREGIYELRYGRRVLLIAVPPPWRFSLEARLCCLLPWFDRWLETRRMRREGWRLKASAR